MAVAVDPVLLLLLLLLGFGGQGASHFTFPWEVFYEAREQWGRRTGWISA